MKKRYLGLVVAFVLALSTPVMASENETVIIPNSENTEVFIDDVEENSIDEENAIAITDEEIVEVDDNTVNETVSVSEPYEEAEEAIEEEEDLLQTENSERIKLSPSSIEVEAGTTFELKLKVDEDSDVSWYWEGEPLIDTPYDVTHEGKRNGKELFKVSVPGTYVIRASKFYSDSNDYGWKSAECKVTVTVPEATVRYRTHVQKIGWQPYVKNGELSGTTGQSLRLEAINIDVSGNPLLGEWSLGYCTHVQTYGWQAWKDNNEMAGTSGEAKRLEAIRINLDSDYYDIYYQTHVQHFGWTGWACNGETCGSTGYGYRLEGIRIKIVRKGEPAPGNTLNIYYSNPSFSMFGGNMPTPKISGALLGYTTHVQSYGWQNYVYDGAMSGTSGQSKRLEGIQISRINPYYGSQFLWGSIVYRTHVQSYGWQNWRENGEMSGTFGESKRLEGIQIYLTRDMAKYYDIYYCVHAQTYGWLDWAKNGEMAGTSGLSKRLEGIKILLVEKGGKAPGATARPYVLGPGGSLPDNPYVEPI